MKITAKNREKYRLLFMNLLVAAAISLIVNFSIFVFRLMPPSSGPSVGRMAARAAQQNFTFPYWELIYFFALAFILTFISTYRLEIARPGRKFMLRLFICIGITAIVYFFAPRYGRHGNLMLLINAPRLFDPMVLLKCSFTLIVSVLYGKVYELTYQRQNIMLENEVLKNENLQATYNMLVNQINPHFFFNSLNSLSMLVREDQKETAITYIERLSDTFRYILHNSTAGMTTVGQELKYLDSYKYLLETRYQDKLFINLDIKHGDLLKKIPSLSVQPLIENAVKHNTITSDTPLVINITSDGTILSVSNIVRPKAYDEEPSGTGLENLAQRYKLLTGRDIKYGRVDGSYIVELPLTD